METVGEWNDEESLHYVEKERDITTKSAIVIIHKVLNHKGVKNMECAFISKSNGIYFIKMMNF